MRSLISLFSVLFLLYGCSQGDSKKDANESIAVATDSTAAAAVMPDTTNLPKFQFEENEFDFGTIKEGEVVKHVFKFTNVGKSALLISDARGSCGCTIPSFPREPTPVGGQGEIEVQFNSKNKAGENKKFVSITANTYPEVTTISIKAKVEANSETKGPISE